jgi:hypothetical protein
MVGLTHSSKSNLCGVSMASRKSSSLAWSLQEWLERHSDEVKRYAGEWVLIHPELGILVHHKLREQFDELVLIVKPNIAKHSQYHFFAEVENILSPPFLLTEEQKEALPKALEEFNPEKYPKHPQPPYKPVVPSLNDMVMDGASSWRRNNNRFGNST